MKVARTVKSETTNHEVVTQAYGDLRNLYCKISGLAQLFADRGDVGSVALNIEDGNYGLGLILEEIGSNVKAVSDSLEALTLRWAQKGSSLMVKTLRVLVVDDDLTIRLTMKSLFDFLGWSVTTAESVDEALMALSKENFDVVVSDVQMPDAGGPELIQLMDSRDLDVPVILMSGSHRYSLEWATDHGAKGFLEKPFGVQEVRDAVYRIIKPL